MSEPKRIAFVVSALTGPELTSGRGDATSIYARLVDPSLGCCDPGQSKIITDCPSQSNFEEELRVFLEGWRSQDQLVFYFSGHGKKLKNLYCLFFGDSEKPSPIIFRNILDEFYLADVVRSILIIDACYSGAAFPSGDKDNIEIDNLEISVELPLGVAMLTSSRRFEKSKELDSSGSVFTKLLSQALDTGIGGKSTEEGLLYLSDIVEYINKSLESDESLKVYKQRAVFQPLNEIQKKIWLSKNVSGSKSEPKKQIKDSNAVHSEAELRLLYEHTEIDKHPCANATYEELDWELIHIFGKNHDPINYDPNLSFEVISKKLNLTSPIPHLGQFQLHRNAILCFSTRPENHFQNAKIIFLVTNSTNEELERKTITGPIPKQIELTLDFIKPYFPKSIDISSTGHRVEDAHDDLVLIRELIANALIHRNYNQSSPVHVTVSPDYIDIRSPGKFSEGISWVFLLKLAKEKERISIPINMTLAYYMDRLKLYENVGRGFRVIQDYISKYGSDAVSCREFPEPSIRIRIKRRKKLENKSVLTKKDIVHHFDDYKADLRMRIGHVRVIGMSRPIDISKLYADVRFLSIPSSYKRYNIKELNKKIKANSLPFYNDTVKINSLREIEKNCKLFILGGPGTGKTSFLRNLASQALNNDSETLPIYIQLSQLASSGQNIPHFIESYFRFPADSNGKDIIEDILRAGKFLILLDGLDEVNLDDNMRGNIAEEIQNCVRKYPKNQFIITCRTAATEYLFDMFTYLEITGFDDPQILNFIKNWFNENEKLAERCWQSLHKNSDLLALSANPFFLTLLCSIYENQFQFPQHRYEFIEEACEMMLSKWDSSRNIQRGTIFHKLSLNRKMFLLAHLAFVTFKKAIYFFEEKEIVQIIDDYLKALPTDTKIDSLLIIREIEAQSGLVVERAKGIFSFSNFVFHEYFTARYIVHEGKEALNLLMRHVGDDRWNEVFLLTASMLPSRDEMFSMYIDSLYKIISTDKKIIDFIEWAKSKISKETNNIENSSNNCSNVSAANISRMYEILDDTFVPASIKLTNDQKTLAHRFLRASTLLLDCIQGDYTKNSEEITKRLGLIK